MKDCGEKVHVRFLCKKHYKVAKRKGHFESPTELFISQKYKMSSRVESYRKYACGGNYGKALKRDGYKCTNCGLTNYRHKMLGNYPLTTGKIGV